MKVFFFSHFQPRGRGREEDIMNRDKYYDYLKNEIEKLPEDTIFLVSDLFKGYIWKSITLADRIWWGLKFLNDVQNNNYFSIQVIEKTTSNKQQYKKIRV